jgi:hypothetical protein
MTLNFACTSALSATGNICMPLPIPSVPTTTSLVKRSSSVLIGAFLPATQMLLSFDQLLDRARTRNEGFLPPLDDTEVIKLTSQAWGYEIRGENRRGRCDAVHLATSDPYAFALLRLLREWHWDPATFILAAPQTAKKIEWPIAKFRDARRILDEGGYIHCVSRGGRGNHDPAVYSWRKVLE